MTARYIAIDWGSTNLRAWLYQGEECLESRQSEAGVTRLNGRSPAAVLAEITQHWRDGATPVVMAGMVGSNVGWKIAPYLPLPAAFSDIGQQLTAVGDNIWIIPGLCVSRDDNHNVMRGEETQLLGARALAPSSVYVMPGTHCVGTGRSPANSRFSYRFDRGIASFVASALAGGRRLTAAGNVRCRIRGRSAARYQQPRRPAAAV